MSSACCRVISHCVRVLARSKNVSPIPVHSADGLVERHATCRAVCDPLLVNAASSSSIRAPRTPEIHRLLSKTHSARPISQELHGTKFLRHCMVAGRLHRQSRESPPNRHCGRARARQERICTWSREKVDHYQYTSVLYQRAMGSTV